MLQARLVGILRNEMDSLNLQLSVYCSQQLEQMVNNGVARMRSSNSLDNPAHVMNAERNLRALVKYLRNYSEKMGSFPVLSNAEFDSAMGSIPTFWPYSSSG